jgi:tricorn protease
MRSFNAFQGRLYSVSPSGDLPEELPLPRGGFCSFSPDGRKLAYNRVFREFRTWKRYRGGMADDIWIYDFDAKTTENITNIPHRTSSRCGTATGSSFSPIATRTSA